MNALTTGHVESEYVFSDDVSTGVVGALSGRQGRDQSRADMIESASPHATAVKCSLDERIKLWETGRQNIFDDPQFFQAYLRFRETDEGFNAELEEPAMLGLVPDVAGKRVIDLGCGTGRLCRRLAKAGAAEVLGVDCSARMIELAESENGEFRKTVKYRRCFMEDFDAPTAGSDLVVSSMALHYVQELGPLFGKVSKWIVPGGVFVFSVEHPIFTAGPRKWLSSTEHGNLWPVSRYAQQGSRVVSWLGHEVLKFHRSFARITNMLLTSDFALLAVDEPCSKQGNAPLPTVSQLENERPAFLLMKSVAHTNRTGLRPLHCMKQFPDSA